MATRAGIADDERHHPLKCWCCGTSQDPAQLVHLGQHPEVAVCVRCAHSLSKWAGQIEDRQRAGASVWTRERIRSLRKAIVRRGWHHNRIIGRPLRWLGRFTP